MKYRENDISEEFDNEIFNDFKKNIKNGNYCGKYF